jgi:hypothetical protein
MRIPRAPNPFMPIRSRLQAESVAGLSTVAAGLLSFLFAAGTPATWTDYGPTKGALMLSLAVLFALSAFISDARKSVFMAVFILASCAVMSAYSALALKPGLLVVPLFGLPCAIAGYRGAKAMRRTDLPIGSWAAGPETGDGPKPEIDPKANVPSPMESTPDLRK